MESKPQETESKADSANDLMKMPEIDPDRFFKIIDSSVQGLKECRLITSALELGVFEALKIPLSAGSLAEKLECDSTIMPHFCEALFSLGLLERFESEKPRNESANNDSMYMVSDLSATYLLENSPFSQKHYLVQRLRNTELWDRLPQIVREGPEIFNKELFFGGVVQSMAENALCGTLQETVRVVIENVDFRRVKKLLDLGGGHGLYAIAFAKENESLQAFVFDLPPVTEKTKEFVKKYRASNVNVIQGDFFKDELGDEYDLIFSSFNPGGKVPSLIPKIAGALNTGGIFVTRQMLDEKVKSNPLFSLDWNLWTFEGVKKGESPYSFENSVSFTEYIGMLDKYGLEVFNSLDLQGESRIVFARKIT
jgi:precorrin-6B methylase 2